MNRFAETRLPYEPLMPCTLVALDVGGTKIGGALVVYHSPDEAPHVVMERSIPTLASEGGEKLLNRIADLVASLLEEQRDLALKPDTKLYGSNTPRAVGIATAGRVDALHGSIAFANELIPGWSGQPVAEYVKSMINLPVFVLNDVQSYALGEARWGAARDVENCLMVAAGTGLGGGIITNGKVLRGAHGFAGEIGHTLCPQAAGIICSCGKEGHLESVVSGSGIEACYLRAGGEALPGAAIAARAQEGEPLATKIIHQSGFCLGAAIGSWINILDPELIIISGSVTKAGPLWREALQEGVHSQLPQPLEEIPIVDATLGSQAPIVGAAEYTLDKLTESVTHPSLQEE